MDDLKKQSLGMPMAGEEPTQPTAPDKPISQPGMGATVDDTVPAGESPMMGKPVSTPTPTSPSGLTDDTATAMPPTTTTMPEPMGTDMGAGTTKGTSEKDMPEPDVTETPAVGSTFKPPTMPGEDENPPTGGSQGGAAGTV